MKLNVECLYLDYNATSPPSSSVLDWLKGGDLLFANPASQHSSGKSSRKVINETRAQIYKTFDKNEKETQLFFHSGATEAMSTFAYSFNELARAQNRKFLICYSKLDHPAVTSLAEKYPSLELTITKDLRYDHQANLKKIKEHKAADSELIILYHHLWVHNETGIVSELSGLEEFKKIPDLYLHVDAVQAPGKITDWRKLSVGDIFSFSTHKFGSFKGLGFSFYPKTMPFYPMITGGTQQSSRSGTENALGVKTIALAMKDLEQVDVAKNSEMRTKLEAFMRQELNGVGEVISSPSQQSSNTIYFYLNTLSSDIALALFDLSGLMISAGSACSSGAAKASPLLLHLGLDKVAKNGLRLSFGFTLSTEELSLIQTRFRTVINKLK